MQIQFYGNIQQSVGNEIAAVQIAIEIIRDLHSRIAAIIASTIQPAITAKYPGMTVNIERFHVDYLEHVDYIDYIDMINMTWEDYDLNGNPAPEGIWQFSYFWVPELLNKNGERLDADAAWMVAREPMQKKFAEPIAEFDWSEVAALGLSVIFDDVPQFCPN